MPKAMERAVIRSARSKGIKRGTPRWRRYVYGALRRRGWVPERERR